MNLKGDGFYPGMIIVLVVSAVHGTYSGDSPIFMLFRMLFVMLFYVIVINIIEYFVKRKKSFLVAESPRAAVRKSQSAYSNRR